MSDRLDVISKEYDKNVLPEESRSVGLFTIPEYPELETRGMWSSVLETLLTTLRFLAPATLLTIFWTHHTFFFDILKYIDSAFRTVIFASEDKKKELIKWLSETGPVKVDDLETVWRHGWIVCGVLDAALPGACAGHPPTRLSLKHAQSIADHYLGVEQMFTSQELEANNTLSKHEEWKLIKFLEQIRLAVAKLTPPPTASKPKIENSALSSTKFTLDYIARGSGLTAAQVNNKMFFKIYPTAQQSLDPGDITISIRGPKDIYGVSTISPILGKAQMIRQTLLGLQSKPSNYTENVLPVTQGTAYLRNYGKNDMSKTYYIPKNNYDIEIDIERKLDHTRVGYIVPSEGKYEISITSRGENIVGSPFMVTASKNIVGILETESFSLENGEEIDIVDVKTDRKVVLRIVDFVTEKMLLKENGTLEKITEEEARNLMELDRDGAMRDVFLNKQRKTKNEDHIEPKLTPNKFYSVARKVLKINQVCKVLHNMEKHQKKNIFTISDNSRSQNGVPDIVNSTFEKNKTTNLYEREKIIIPENISVSLLMNKSTRDDSIPNEQPQSLENECNKLDMENYKIMQDPFEDDNLCIDTIQSTNNPFLNDMFDSSFTEKEFGSFIRSEYETNNSQNEECHTFSNPFINFEHLQKDIQNNSESFRREYEDEIIHTDMTISTDDVIERIEIIENEYTNPFITISQSESISEKAPVTDFIIGAPVSLPSVIGKSLKENTISSLNNNNEDMNFHDNYNFPKDKENISFLSSQESLEQREDPPAISPFHSLGSDTYNFLNQSNLQRSRNISPKDLWDSAYVSIDDSASSSDNTCNYNDRSVSETFVKSNYSINDFNDDTSAVHGDTWNKSEQLDNNSIHDDLRGLRWEFKRQVFTPIIEENEKSMTYITKENTNEHETDTVSRAFAEINEIYDDIFPKTEQSLSSIDETTLQNCELEYITENNEIRVDSASENTSDVKRLAGEIEGSISEVQANDTESVSASRNLKIKVEEDSNLENNKDKIQFGDSVYSNIVLEKKQYWDEKIRQIEAKTMEESKMQQKRKRLSAKHFRHNDSLSRRKGKQIVKKFLNSSVQSPQDQKYVDQIDALNVHSEMHSNVKLVEKWKTFWDNRLEEENKDVSNIPCTKDTHVPRQSLKNMTNSQVTSTDTKGATVKNNAESNISENMIDNNPIPVKHELPEEVFKAFETSPKRFFGTSRKHILNKIDSFLGSPKIENIPEPENSNVSHESGLVSSRISMFHKISNTEELSLERRPHIQKLFNTNSFVTINNTKQPSNDLSRKCQNGTTISKEIHNVVYKHNIIDVENQFLDIPSGNEKESIIHVAHNKETAIPLDDNTTANPSFESNDKLNENVKCPKLKSFSKSEMDIFNKIPSNDVMEDFDKHKSVEDLPKINVKSFITLYEDVSKSTQLKKSDTDLKPFASSKHLYNSSSSPGTPCKSYQNPTASKHFIDNYYGKLTKEKEMHIKQESGENQDQTRCSSVMSECESSSEREKKYLSLSDIELEIIEKTSDNAESTNEIKAAEINHLDYKSRFKMAKQYFQSLEELRDIKKDRKLSECKIVLNNQSIESLENIEVKPKKNKTRKTKSKSMPSSEIAKIWDQMQGIQKDKEDKKLVKISEKFNVEDLFEDVMEGRLSRQGSLRGIPHKKAVLEAFKSMENLSENKLNSYDMAVSEVNTFSQQNQTKNAQTYLSEYPYLPTTEPSKFQPRFDANASGLISYDELLKSKPRRNSVPDIRLNPKFTEDL